MSRLMTHRACHSRYPDNLSEQDQRTYRRWVRGLFVFYSIAIGVAVAAGFAHRPAGDLTASTEGAKHLTTANSRPAFGTSAAAAEKR
jgi:hypothetical protein